MKKVMLFIASMLFAVSANAATLSAATLSWVPDNADFALSVPGSEIGATETYSANGKGAHLDVLHFTSNVDTAISSLTTATTASQFSIKSITLDGVALSYLGVGLGNVAVWSLVGGMHILASIQHEVIVAVSSVTGAGQLNVQVSSVPVPAALFLFAPALLGFFGLRRKATTSALAA